MRSWKYMVYGRFTRTSSQFWRWKGERKRNSNRVPAHAVQHADTQDAPRASHQRSRERRERTHDSSGHHIGIWLDSILFFPASSVRARVCGGSLSSLPLSSQIPGCVRLGPGYVSGHARHGHAYGRRRPASTYASRDEILLINTAVAC